MKTKAKNIAVVGVLLACVLIPIGLVILLLNAIFVGWDRSILNGLLNEIE